MKINKELVLSVAKNARLNLSEKEIEEFLPQFEDVLNSFEDIKKVDTKGIKEAFHPVEIRDHVREDKVEKSLTQEEALKNTKQKKEGYFKGPKSI